MIVAGEDTFDTGHIGTGVYADALGFGDLSLPGVPSIVGHLEFRADRPSGDDSRAAIIAGYVVSMTVRNAEPTTTPALPDAIIIQSFAVVVVIIAVLVPLVDHQGTRALDPHIHATAHRALAWNQVLVVHAMSDAIALPGHVAVALADLPCVGFHNRLRHGGQSGSVHDVVGPRLPRRQICLEKKCVWRLP